jgi:hypothetical protein
MTSALYLICKLSIKVVYGAFQSAILWVLAIIVVGSIMLLITGWMKGLDTRTIISLAISSSSSFEAIRVGFLMGLVIGGVVNLPQAILGFLYGRS